MKMAEATVGTRVFVAGWFGTITGRLPLLGMVEVRFAHRERHKNKSSWVFVGRLTKYTPTIVTVRLPEPTAMDHLDPGPPQRRFQ